MFILQGKKKEKQQTNKKNREAEMWNEQGRENSINGKYILICFSYMIHKKSYTQNMYQFLLVRQMSLRETYWPTDLTSNIAPGHWWKSEITVKENNF